jgi:aryl-phospho-beta-D-glucosidase BglC (GH1 family)
VEFLAKRYKDDPAFLGIGLLNEPAGTTTTPTLKDYYIEAYNRIRKDGNSILLSHAPLVTEQDHNHWADFAPPPQYQGFLH